jgi:hypothetical protein
VATGVRNFPTDPWRRPRSAGVATSGGGGQTAARTAGMPANGRYSWSDAAAIRAKSACDPWNHG